jgi:NADH-quinone oxidoreductase subunit N
MSIGAPFIPTWTDLRSFAAPLWLPMTIVALLLTPFFVRKPNRACAWVALIGLAAPLFWLLATGPVPGCGGFASMLSADCVSYFWNILLLLFTIGVVLMWMAAVAPTLRQGDGPEFFVLLVGATLGMSLMGSAANLLIVFLSLELASLPSYVLAGFHKTERLGAEASLKYVLFGAASSAITIYGLSILYGLYGSMELQIIAERVAMTNGGTAMLGVALLAIFVGVGFKIAAVPFHFWCPDVFEGAGIDVTAFLSVASKGAGLVLLLRLADALTIVATPDGAARIAAIRGVIGAIGAITVTAGNVAAFPQNNIKRLLAYSSIAQAGYMLCGAALVGAGGTAAVLFYLAVYLFMNLGAFVVAAVVWSESGSADISAFNGLGRRAPLLAVCMTAFLLSFIGIPPLGGFVAKLNVMLLLGRLGGWGWALVVIIAVNTAMSLYYYARIIAAMYLRDTKAPAFDPPPLASALSIACAGTLVVTMIAFSPLQRLATNYGRFAAPVAASR